MIKAVKKYKLKHKKEQSQYQTVYHKTYTVYRKDLRHLIKYAKESGLSFTEFKKSKDKLKKKYGIKQVIICEVLNE